jgi:hypothetical protein
VTKKNLRQKFFEILGVFVEGGVFRVRDQEILKDIRAFAGESLRAGGRHPVVFAKNKKSVERLFLEFFGVVKNRGDVEILEIQDIREKQVGPEREFHEEFDEIFLRGKFFARVPFFEHAFEPIFLGEVQILCQENGRYSQVKQS